MPTPQQQQRFIKIATLYLELRNEMPLINKLVYGYKIKYEDKKTKSIVEGVLYLHENNPQIIILLGDNGDVDALDMKKMEITKAVNKVYPGIILKDFGTQCCILIQDQKQREQTEQQFRQIKKKMCEVPSQTDSDILKNFIKADKNRNQTMQRLQFEQMLRQMKLEQPKQKQQIYKYLQSIGCSKQITIKKFQLVTRYLLCRSQFLSKFQQLTNSTLKHPGQYLQKIMKKEQFVMFLIKVQEQREERIEEILKYYPNQLSFFDFCHYLQSKFNNVGYLDLEEESVNEEFPLYKFYCYSSHNTYLTGNQFSSFSSAERYFQDLNSGIRCLQIDTVDSSSGPVVYHRFTLTSQIPFAQVLNQVKNFTDLHKHDKQQHTPIILSIDNGCSIQNQNIMAKLLIQTFKQKLFIIKKYYQQNKLKNNSRQYPSLRQLRGKIIVKCAGSFLDYEKVILDNPNYLETFTEINIQMKEHEQLRQQSQVIQNKEVKKKVQYVIVEKKIQMKMKIDHKLLQYTAMLGKGLIGKPSPWESVSLVETDLAQRYNKEISKAMIMKHVEDGWIRSYPSFSINSTNFDPYPSLQMGVQLIALNSQYGDIYSCLMKSFFQRTLKKCAGYRKKRQLIPFTGINKNNTRYVRIRPISASKIYYNKMQDNSNPPQVQIKMKLFCYSEDRKLNHKQTQDWVAYTQKIQNNGYNPRFELKKDMSVHYTCDWLGFIGIKVENAGVGVIPLEGIKSGYRFVQLYDQEFVKKESKIFLQIRKTK